MKTPFRKNFFRKKTIPFFSAGFTFIEMLVAVSILLLSIVGPLYLSSQGLRAARIARDQINANYLAQEAIEYIRYRRDTNVSNGQGWMDGFSECYDAWCAFDIHVDQRQSCPLTDTCPLFFEDGTGKYGYPVSGETWIETKFTRRIYIDVTSYPLGNEVDVTATVSWQDGVINRSYTVTEHLLNWQ